MPLDGPSSATVAAATALRADAASVAVIRALRSSGIEPVLLKGATFSFLYTDAPRSYVDVDLLVAPEAVSIAGGVLNELGYSSLLEGAVAPERPAHAATYTRANAVPIDLHWMIPGVTAPSDEAWAVLSERAVPFEVAGSGTRALDLPARLMHVALHMAQSGPLVMKTRYDLVRALEIGSEEQWSDAAALANTLGASRAFSAGLRVLPAGAALADRLGLPSDFTLEEELARTSAASPSKSVARLASTPGFRPRARLVGRALVPTTASLRLSSRVARHGPAGMALAYLARPFKVAARLPKAVYVTVTTARTLRR